MLRRLMVAVAVAFVALIGLYVFSQLRPSRIEVPPPGGATGPHSVVPPSRLGVDLQVTLPALTQVLNQHVPKSHKGRENDVLGNYATEDYVDWTATLGEFALSPSGDAVSVQVPVSGSATGHARVGVKKKNKGLLGKLEEAAGATASQTIDLAGTVRGTLRPRIMPDWTVQPGLALSVDLSKAEMKLFKTIDLSLREKLEQKLNDEAASLTTKLNKQLASDRTLQGKMEVIWRDLHVVAQVNETPPVWVALKPVAIQTAPPAIGANSLDLHFEIIAQSAVHVGSDAPPVSQSPLPNLGQSSSLGGFAITLPVSISLSEFHGVRPAQLGMEDEIKTEAGSVRVKRIYPLADKDRLYLGADLVADAGLLTKIEATVFLTGRPELEQDQGQLRFANVDYDLRTRSALAGTADVLLQPVVLSHLQTIAVFDVAGLRKDAVSGMNKELAKLVFKLPQGINADLALTDVKINGIRTSPGWLHVLLEGSGRSNLTVTKLDGVLGR
jgi:hypothetical protein